MAEPKPKSSAKRALRQQFLSERLALPESRRRLMNHQICGHVVRFMEDRARSRVSGFWSFKGEPDMAPALKVLHESGQQIYLPALEGDAMVFRRWKPGTPMEANHFGIPEPHDRERSAPDALDWVFMPMLAFSATGTRLGMGGGFYDRTFSFLTSPASRRGPALIGIAYSTQEANSLPADHWDVPLDAVITDFGLREFQRPGRDS
jgi:5-formyltetrahydrofolate cyclo-ligase